MFSPAAPRVDEPATTASSRRRLSAAWSSFWRAPLLERLHLGQRAVRVAELAVDLAGGVGELEDRGLAAARHVLAQVVLLAGEADDLALDLLERVLEGDGDALERVDGGALGPAAAQQHRRDHDATARKAHPAIGHNSAGLHGPRPRKVRVWPLRRRSDPRPSDQSPIDASAADRVTCVQ